MDVPFFLVDVFATEPLTGNPLAVVADAVALDDATMKRIAREFNQSETTFVLPPTQAGATWRLRCFTPGGFEAFGAGHNALGAWWWLAAAGRLRLDGTRSSFIQELGGRLLPVEVIAESGRPKRVVMMQTPPSFGRVCQDAEALAGALRLRVGDLMIDRFPAQVVSTGAPHMMLAVRDRPVVNRAKPDHEALAALLASVDGQGCYLFCLDPEDPGATAHARFFNPTAGIWEDPATGSAAGPLACYLTQQGVTTPGANIIVEQGFAMGPSPVSSPAP